MAAEHTEAGDPRERILDAAVRTLAAGGIDDVRIARVARMAGVSTGLVHYYFETREALLAEALDRSYRLAGDARAGKYGRGSAAVRLARKLDKSLPLPGPQLHEWELWVELWLRAVRDPGLRDTAARVYAGLHESLRDLIVEGIQAGEFQAEDPDGIAERILALVDGLGLRALLGDPAIPVERAREHLRTALARELGLDALPG